MSEEFWMHEDAPDPDEFGADTPELALTSWLRYGAMTGEFDPDFDGSANIEQVIEACHTIYHCRWTTVRDEEHRRDLIDDIDNDWSDETLKVGDSYWSSFGFRTMKACLSIAISPAKPE